MNVIDNSNAVQQGNRIYIIKAQCVKKLHMEANRIWLLRMEIETLMN